MPMIVRRSKFNKYRKAYRKRKLAKAKGQMKSNFTEFLDAGYLNSNTGGLLSAQFNSIPQHSHYAALYRQYCITKLDVMLVPEYNSAEVNQAASNASVTGPSAPTFNGVARISYAPVFSADTVAPSNEIVVLSNNAAKIRPITQNGIVKFSCNPVPALSQQNYDALLPSTVPVSKRGQWISTDPASNGDTIYHKGIQFWVTQQINAAYAVQFTVAHVYYRIHFKLRDPK